MLMSTEPPYGAVVCAPCLRLKRTYECTFDSSGGGATNATFAAARTKNSNTFHSNHSGKNVWIPAKTRYLLGTLALPLAHL